MGRFNSGRVFGAFVIIFAAHQGVAAADWKMQRDEGRKALQAGDLGAAEKRMKQAIVEIKKLGAGHDLELAEAFAGLSDVYLAQERMTEANVVLEQSLLLLGQTPETNGEVLERVYGNLAAVRVFQKNLPEAESLLKLTLATREKRLGTQNPSLAELLERMAILSLEMKNEEKAIALHRRAVAVREKAPGASPSQVIRALNEGAEWYVQHGQDKEAEAVWHRVLAIQEKTLGAEHSDVAVTLMRMARLHTRLNSSGGFSIPLSLSEVKLFPTEVERNGYVKRVLDEVNYAEPLLTRALAIREKAFGATDERTIEVLELLAPGYGVRREFSRAIPFFARILAAREKTLGREHPDLKELLAFFASHAMDEGKYREAIPYLKRLVVIQAAEKSKKSADDSASISFPLGPIEDREKEDDPADFAAQLRKAERLAVFEDDPTSRPTEEDLAYFERQKGATGLTDLPSLMAITNLDLNGEIVNLTTLAHIRGLVNLKSLTLTRAQIIGGPERLNQKSLNLDHAFGDEPGPNINDGLTNLRKLTGLRTLSFFGSRIRGPGLSALAGMTELESLNLGFTGVGDDEIAALPVLPQLRDLELDGARMSDASLKHLMRFPKLESLKLYGTNVSAKGIDELKRAHPGLKVIGPKLPELH